MDFDLPAECTVSFGGVAAFVLLAALPIAIAITWATVMLYRRNVAAVMRSLAAPPHRGIANDLPSPARNATPPNRLLHLDFCTPESLEASGSGLTQRAESGARKAGIAYAVAGTAHAVIVTVLTFVLGDLELLPVRTFVVAYLYAWPIVPTLMLTSINNPRLKWLWLLGYFALMFSADMALSVFGFRDDPNSGSLFIIWLTWMAPPTLLLWILSNRAWRSVGLSAYFVAIGLVSGWLLSTQSIACLALSLNDPGIWLRYRWATLALAWVVIVGGAWWMLQRTARRYRQKMMSDQSLILDSWWLVVTLAEIVIQFDSTQGASVSFILAWFAYRWISRRLQPVPDDSHPPPSLLLLRVFGHRRRSRQLLDQLSQRWRHIGPITLIGAPDLAATNLEPDELMQFWGLRLRQLFIATTADLRHRLERLDDRPDPDGRYRVNEFFCYSNTWQDTVNALANRSDVLIMDLRGFGIQHHGCRFELEMLLNHIRLEKILLLIDTSTDKEMLKKLLQQLWHRLLVDSVNRWENQPRIRLFEATGPLHSVTGLIKLVTNGLR